MNYANKDVDGNYTDDVVEHELGHILGLHHGGGDRLNCKPNYMSLMNYAYEGLGSFSVGQNNELIPGMLDESTGVGPAGTNGVLVTAFDFGSTSGAGTSVDWNRNGEIDSGAVHGITRTPTGVPDNECWRSLLHAGTADVPEQHLEAQIAASAGDDALYAWYTTTDNQLRRVRFTGSLEPCAGASSDPPDCCPMEVNEALDYQGCGVWEPPSTVPTGPTWSDPAATPLGPNQAVGVIEGTGAGIALRVHLVSDDGDVLDTQPVSAAVSSNSGQVLRHPAMTTVLLADGTEVLAVYFYEPGPDRQRVRLFESDLGLLFGAANLYLPDEFSFLRSSQSVSVAYDAGAGRVWLAGVDPDDMSSNPQIELYRTTDPIPPSTDEVTNASWLANFVSVPDLLPEPFTYGTTGRPAIYADPSTGYLELWYPGFDAVTRRAWSIDPLTRPFEMSFAINEYTPGASFGSTGVALTMYRGHLQVIGGAGELLHAPFAGDTFPLPEEDVPDRDMIDARMCCSLTLQQDSSICAPPPGVPGPDPCATFVAEPESCYGD